MTIAAPAMCSLLVLLGVDAAFPILVAANRDELRGRRASPPGLWVGARRRVLSPRDSRAGGTWLGVNDAGWFAGLTNVAGVEAPAGAASRGELPHLALDAADLDDAVRGVVQATRARRYGGFQLLLTDGDDARLVVHDGEAARAGAVAGPVITLSNQHRIHELTLPGVEAARAPGLDVDDRLDLLAALLLDRGERSGHAVLKGSDGSEYGTVSSSLIAVPPAARLRDLRWRYAPGPPDAVAYRSYGNLARRLG